MFPVDEYSIPTILKNFHGTLSDAFSLYLIPRLPTDAIYGLCQTHATFFEAFLKFIEHDKEGLYCIHKQITLKNFYDDFFRAYSDREKLKNSLLNMFETHADRILLNMKKYFDVVNTGLPREEHISFVNFIIHFLNGSDIPRIAHCLTDEFRREFLQPFSIQNLEIIMSQLQQHLNHFEAQEFHVFFRSVMSPDKIDLYKTSLTFYSDSIKRYIAYVTSKSRRQRHQALPDGNGQGPMINFDEDIVLYLEAQRSENFYTRFNLNKVYAVAGITIFIIYRICIQHFGKLKEALVLLTILILSILAISFLWMVARKRFGKIQKFNRLFHTPEQLLENAPLLPR